MIPNVEYMRPHSLKQALDMLAIEGRAIHAGGTDLMGQLREELTHPSGLVSLSGLKELQGIEPLPSGGWRIKAMTRLADVASFEAFQGPYRVLAQAAASVASPQLRNQGTLAGNLCQRPRCWYFRQGFNCARKGGRACYAKLGENRNHCLFNGYRCYIVHPSDTASALTALGATVHVAGRNATRIVPIEDFFVLPKQDPMKETVLQPDELITHIDLPPLEGEVKSAYRKIRARQTWDFALAGLASVLWMQGKTVTKARLVLSAVSPAPYRVPEAEQTLQGKVITPELAKKAGEFAMKGAEPLAQNGYKMPLIQGMIQEELLALVE